MTATDIAGLTVRPPQPDDAQAICDLIAAYEIAHTGEADVLTPEDIREGWHGLTLETDAWVFLGSEERLVGYGEVRDHGYGQIWADNFVHPDYMGRGIGTALVQLTGARAFELVGSAPEGARVALGNGVLLEDKAARALLEREGYHLVRIHWRMSLELDAEPPAPDWPEGITLRAFTCNQDERPVFDAIEEAFSDHWGHVPYRYDEWIRRLDRSDFDPALWFLALDGDQIAGVVLCRQRPETAWISNLAVRRPWRQRGLGTALLRHAFRACWERGERRVGLGVDGQSLTGATRLYERAGMRAVEQVALYEKELRPGVDLSIRELTS